MRHAAESNSILLPSLPDLVWGTIAFVVVLVVVWKLVLPNVTKALDARAEAIEGGLKKAEEAQAGAQKALEQYNAQLAEARAEAGKIRDQAREDAKKIRAELVEQAQADAARIVAETSGLIRVRHALEPIVREWVAAAETEPWTIPHEEDVGKR